MNKFYYSTIIRSSTKHIEELRIYLNSKQFDIISVNETMLDNSILDEIAVHGYELVYERIQIAMVLWVFRDLINYKIRADN